MLICLLMNTFLLGDGYAQETVILGDPESIVTSTLVPHSYILSEGHCFKKMCD